MYFCGDVVISTIPFVGLLADHPDRSMSDHYVITSDRTLVGVYTGELRTRACSPSGYAPALNADSKENEG
ncbi:hypothetical protein ALC62_11807 [Cyphomyrmex costatus]|uniref:Uncharacterized protein n=1 Tax=Cyphomyrmex costatus TaxID=456900 RepID=A0A195CBM4_9HYME|nr:hypothetical protein ALC62_11807 [Cyphomyrmex costatus]